jgi:hypothetical protein
MSVASRERAGASALGDVRLATPVVAALVLLCGAGAMLVIALRSRLTFFNDDWWFLLQRPGLESHGGLDTLLAPHNGNIVVLLAASYKVLVAAFGMGSQLPWALVSGLTLAVLGVLVFVLVDQRLGPVLGLVAAAVVVFMGPAWEALLFFASISHLGALTLGVAALLALELDSKSRNATACGLLVCAVLLFTVGLPFVAGAAIVVLVVRKRPRQLWIPAVPTAVFAAWWIVYGHQQSSGVTAGNIGHLPRYVFDALSSGLASLTGTVHASLPSILSTGHLVAVLALLLLAWWLVRGGRPSSWAVVFAGTALVFWVLTGASAIPGRTASASRYQLTSAVLLILLASELLRGVRLDRGRLAGVCVVAAVIVVSNVVAMRAGYDFLRAESQAAKVDLGALELGRSAAPADLLLKPSVAHDQYLNGVTAGRYFTQTDAHGSPPVYSPSQIATASPVQRNGADSVLARAEGIVARPVPATRSGAGCAPLAAGTRQPGPSIPLPGSGLIVTNRGRVPLLVGVRVFAPTLRPVYIGFVVGKGSVRVMIPRQAARLRWQLGLTGGAAAGGAAATVCPV